MSFNWTLSYAVKPAFCDLAEKCFCFVCTRVMLLWMCLSLVSVDHSKEDSRGRSRRVMKSKAKLAFDLWSVLNELGHGLSLIHI